MKILSFLASLNIFLTSSLDIINYSATALIDGEILEQPFLAGLNYPQVQWIDLNQDENNELLVLDEDGCIRVYNYVLSSEGLSDSFFEIVDTAYGGLCGMSWFNIEDINQDGHLDLACQSFESSNEVQIYHIINDEFFLVGTLFDDSGLPIISDSVMVPTFADIDGDGDYDFFTGNQIGTVTFYENIGIFDEIPLFHLVSFEWQNIWVVGPSRENRHGANAINFIDIDSDGDLDLCWGDYFQRSLYLIYNIGSSINPIMDIENIISDFPHNDPIYTVGRNMPSFNDIDLDGDLDLFISVLGGDGGVQLSHNFLLYENIDNSFSLSSDNFMNTIDLNSDIAPQMVDIDSDGDLDLFIGQDYNTSTFPIRGRIYFFRNIGDSMQDIFELENNEFLGDNIGNSLIPFFTDIDADQDMDLFVGNYNGNILFYRNIGDSNIMSLIYESDLMNIDLGGYSSPSFIDIDSDGDLDLFVGSNSGKISFYINTGDSLNINLEFVTDSFFNIDVGSHSHPTFIDIDSDNDYDLIVGSNSQNIKIYRNIGDIYQASYIQDDCIEVPYYGMNTKPNFYIKEDTIFNLVGLSTGGLINSQLNSSLGDLNSDNLNNIEDIVIIVNYIVNFTQNINFCSGDINSDQYIDVLDILLLINAILN